MAIQNPAELMAHRDPTVIDKALPRQERFLPRLTRLLKIGVTHGPIYATALARMTSTAEYDPEDNWNFWTKPRNEIVESLLRCYPGRRRRRKLLEKMLRQGHAEGIEFHYDVSNDFYRLFLDKDYMFYSCAAPERRRAAPGRGRLRRHRAGAPPAGALCVLHGDQGGRVIPAAPERLARLLEEAHPGLSIKFVPPHQVDALKPAAPRNLDAHKKAA